MLAGTTIAGRFELEEQAGQGASGTVFRARDLRTGERVAVKIVRAADDANEARFVREAQVLAQLHHPGLARYIEHGVTGRGDRYLAMEWLEGEDLHGRLRRGELTVHEAVTLARRVSEALAAVHGRGSCTATSSPGTSSSAAGTRTGPR